MSAESEEERSVEVLALPDGVDEELLYLYFENKGRSGGGALVSVEKMDSRALLVFEEAEAAARVLSKREHVLLNVELRVRKPPSKDQHRLLLRGINPNTSTEMIELYVENMIGLSLSDYTLDHSPGGELVLIHLSEPFSKDLQNLNAKISRRPLDGAKVTLEQIQQTDTILVEKLHPGTTPDLLTSYFESQQFGNQKVKEVTMLSEATAKVSFLDHGSVGAVLAQPHKLDGADLAVTPYFSLLQPTEPITIQHSSNDVTARKSADAGDTEMQIDPLSVVSDNTQSSQMDSEPLAEAEVMEDQTQDTDEPSSLVAISDPVKLTLFQYSAFRQDIEKAHPNFTIQIRGDGVNIAGADSKTSEQIKHLMLDFFSNIAEAHFTLEPEKAQFLSGDDVKELLLQTMNESGSPSVYTVSDCNVAVTSLSQSSADQACCFLKSQLCHFSMPVGKEHECMLYSREWSEFLQALGASSVTVSEQGGNIDVLTLKGMENEKQTAILKFLSTPIERETVISMAPGALKYIQIHCHQLLADMDQVSIFPLEGEDVCGLKIHGHAAACQMAEELWQGVVSTICTKSITVNATGVTRFVGDEECKGIFKQMEEKFQVYISLKLVPWEPLLNQDIFVVAWEMMSHKNFQKMSVDGPAQELKSPSMDMDHDGVPERGLLEEAKKIVSSIEERPEEGVPSSDLLGSLDDVDLYTAEAPSNLCDLDSDVKIVDSSQPLAIGNASCLEEAAQLSLAIQYSLESSHRSVEDEEEELKKALELSRKMVQHQVLQMDQLEKGSNTSFQDAITAANTVQINVFAGYTCDLIRVDIAFKKKVAQRQVEEKLELKRTNNMTEYHQKCLEVIKRKHAVEILIQGTMIVISGFKDYVAGALSDVKLLLDKISHSVLDQEILGTIQWVQHDPTSSAKIPYSPDATVFIENAWRMKLKKVDLLLDNQPHIINFEKMQECSVASGKSVKISRKLLCLGDVEDDLPEEEYSLLSNLPDATKLKEDSDEFQNVVKTFYESIKEYHSKIRIIQVEKLMNRLLRSQYKLKKASVLQRALNSQIERTLYHGTSETSVKEICIHGFNRSFCGKNATVYGQGVYFAVDSAFSVKDQYSPPNAEGLKFVFVSKVLTGDFTKGCHSMKAAPLKETGDIPLRYDSVTDNVDNPSMFVIFNDTQAYPEYLITCQRVLR